MKRRKQISGKPIQQLASVIYRLLKIPKQEGTGKEAETSETITVRDSAEMPAIAPNKRIS